jgi:exopolysaccharide production protein ExoZ
VTFFVAMVYGSDNTHLLMFFAFWPHSGPAGQGWPVVGQGWTLNFEVLFYLIFAATLILPLRIRAWIVAGVLAALSTAGYLLQSQNFALATYTSPLLLEFAAGALLYELWRRRLIPTGLPAASVLAGTVLTLVLQAQMGSSDHRWAVWGVTSVFLLAGGLGMERAGWMPRWPMLKLLGDSSYSLYLIQFFVLNPLHHRLAGWPQLVAVPVSLACCAAVGLACYGLLERPLQHLPWLRIRLSSLGLDRRFSG